MARVILADLYHALNLDIRKRPEAGGRVVKGPMA
jgi:hypothetical protein